MAISRIQDLCFILLGTHPSGTRTLTLRCKYIQLISLKYDETCIKLDCTSSHYSSLLKMLVT
ncbi:unnamed protein product [Schistosoma curassoni]|uniref:Ovule protein n=1 Tax=Schistosoma curassoni TaxID=6186 RepID=A0A183K6G8_9TREM|nr:unnamed protein product [Schistosoma curassoni]